MKILNSLLMIGIVILALGCNSKQTLMFKLITQTQLVHNMTQQTPIFESINQQELVHRCWEENMWQCQEHCSRISSLKYSNLLWFDSLQFDTNNDSIVNGSEKKEMDYVLHINKLCMDECIEEEVDDCFE